MKKRTARRLEYIANELYRVAQFFLKRKTEILHFCTSYQ
jgi:hypothetical protein